MATTTNFNLPYPEGSEIYNPLITEPVAMPIIDGQMRDNQLAGIQEASHVKQGNNHALTTSVSGATRFVFIASDDYVTGDSFTVNGQDVTVRIPTGEAPKTDCFKINSAVVCVLDSGILTLETYNKTIIDASLNVASVNAVTNAAVTAAITATQTVANETASKVGSGTVSGSDTLIEAVNKNTDRIVVFEGTTGPKDSWKSLFGPELYPATEYVLIGAVVNPTSGLWTSEIYQQFNGNIFVALNERDGCAIYTKSEGYENRPLKLILAKYA